MNFARDVVDAAPGGDRALVEIDAAGARRDGRSPRSSDASARLAGTFVARGVRRGDVVMTLIGSRPQWVLSMVACFRIGAIVLPCNEQLRAKDLRMRIDAAAPRLIVCDVRNAGELSAALAGRHRPPDVILIPDPSLLDVRARPGRRAGADRPLPDHVHERHHRRRQGHHPRPAIPARPGAAGLDLARRPARRPGLVHRRQRLVEVRAQRVHRAVAAGRRGAAARRPLRSRAAAGAAGVRAGQRALHGADRVPRDRQARDARAGAVAAWPGGGRRGAQPRGPADVRGRDRPADPRRLRPDRDRPADRRARGRRRPARLDGPAAARRRARGARRRAGADRPDDRPDVLRRLSRRRSGARRTSRGTPATGSPPTRTASCSSRAAPTT